MKMKDLKGKAMWPTTTGLSDKELQMRSDPRARALLVTRDVGCVPQY